jgi:inner membrane protein
VDIATHALASFALARGLFPRRRWPTILGTIFAGTIADVDYLSLWFGPAAYFVSRRTLTHSLLGTVGIIFLSVLFVRYIAKQQADSLAATILPLTLAALLHVALDFLQSEGVALLWPFRHERYAADSLPSIDLWILALLLAGILVPELFRLVTSEIGVKEKRPRGQNGALVALALIAAYIGVRVLFHSGSTALLDPHSYKGESARRVGAFPDALSIFTWHGVVETQSFLCQVAVPAVPGRNFDPETAECLHKPEVSPELTAAQQTDVARAYIQVMPFPRAIVARTRDGYEVVIRSMRDIAENEYRHRLAARIILDSQLGISAEQFVWVNEVRVR